MKIEMERHQIINLIMACTAADNCSSPGTKKWKKLHDQLMNVLLEYDSDIQAEKINSRKVYKVGEHNE